MRADRMASSLCSIAVACGEPESEGPPPGQDQDAGPGADVGPGSADAGPDAGPGNGGTDGGPGGEGDGASATKLAQHWMYGATLALSASDVYTLGRNNSGDHFTDPVQGLIRVSKAGGSHEHVRSAIDWYLGALAVSATHVYVSNDRKVVRVPLAGGDAETLGDTGSTVAELEVADAYLYVASRSSIRRFPLGGGASEQLATASEGRALGLDAEFVYWADIGGTGAIKKVPLAGGAATALQSGVKANDLAVTATSVYWTTYGGTGTRVWKAPLAGGAAVLVADGQAAPLGMAADATHAYWANASFAAPTQGSIMRVSIATGEVEPVAQKVPNPNYLALDDGFVYWTGFNGSSGGIWKIAK